VPAVEGLAISGPSAPSVESNTTFVNGRRTSWRRTRWSLGVRPLQTGEFEIPPIELEVDGQALRTAPIPLRVVEDLRGADLGFLEITPSPARVVEGQPFSLELRFGWDAGLNVQFANLALPWWGQLPGTLELEMGALPPGAQRVEGVTINERLGAVVEELPATEVGQRSFRTMRLVQSFLPARAGTVEFPTSFLEFGEVERALFGGTTKGKSHFVAQPAFSLEVVPLPEAGRPLDYSGAVGTLAARATVDSADVRVGESIKLTVDWTGAGNLEFFTSPDPGRLDAFRDFRVYGKTEEKSFDRRRVVYDLAPLNARVSAIPPLPLSVFDPGQGSYRVVATEPVPIRVRELEGAVLLPEDQEVEHAPDLRDIDSAALGPAVEAGSGGSPSDGLLAAALAGLPLAWLGLRSTRRRRGDPGAPLERRRRAARRRLARALRRAADARAELDAFAAFLAARTREPDEAWVGRDARAWRAQDEARFSDVAPGAVEALAAIQARLERAVYGGGEPVSSAELLAVADRCLEGGL
jgi:hypothetical protein